MKNTILTFPSKEVQETRMIERLTELKRLNFELLDMQDRIYEEAMSITGETERNGHTQDFLSNDPDMSAADLFANMESNPSHLWLTSDGVLSDEFLEVTK